jgi:hypothetical protein
MGLPATLGEDCAYLGASAVKLGRWVSRSQHCTAQRRVRSRSVDPSGSTLRRRWVSWSVGPSCDGSGCLGPWSVGPRCDEVGCLGPLGPLRRRRVSWSVVRLGRWVSWSAWSGRWVSWSACLAPGSSHLVDRVAVGDLQVFGNNDKPPAITDQRGDVEKAKTSFQRGPSRRQRLRGQHGPAPPAARRS